MLVARTKAVLGEIIFRAASIRQLHIIGCSRSGTTMLHAAMSAFDDVLLHPAETRAAQPTLRERLAAIRGYGRAGMSLTARKYFVTKRAYAWIEPGEIARLGARIRAEDVGIINIVRDPRDVLLSRHKSAGNDPYVNAEHWRRSMEAADAIEASVGPHGRFVTVRYEDVIREPRAVERTFADAFGLKLRAGAEIDKVADSLASSGMGLSDYMKVAMQGVRNADPKSIGKWREAPVNPDTDLLADPAAAPLYHRAIDRFGYDA